MSQDGVNPYRLLREIEARFVAGAHGLPQREQARQIWRGIGFTLLGRQRLAPLDQVDEILTLPSLTRVPLTQSWMLGVANVRGNLLPVIDMHAYLTGQLIPVTKEARVLAVRDGELFFGLLVESVSGLQSLDVQDRIEDAGDARDELTPYTDGAFRVGDDAWLVVDFLRLALDERFLQVAA